MTVNSFAADSGVRDTATGDYRPGVCNIGPAEIRRRRMVGHVGLVTTAALFAVLVAIDAPPITRLLAILPAAVSASGYIQAQLRFCAGFGARGILNFGEAGEWVEVTDDEARAADRRRARQISLASLVIGCVVGLAAFLLPI